MTTSPPFADAIRVPTPGVAGGRAGDGGRPGRGGADAAYPHFGPDPEQIAPKVLAALTPTMEHNA